MKVEQKEAYVLTLSREEYIEIIKAIYCVIEHAEKPNWLANRLSNEFIHIDISKH